MQMTRPGRSPRHSASTTLCDEKDGTPAKEIFPMLFRSTILSIIARKYGCRACCVLVLFLFTLSGWCVLMCSSRASSLLVIAVVRWEKVMEYEKFHDCGKVRLKRFCGRPQHLSPKARFLHFLGYAHVSILHTTDTHSLTHSPPHPIVVVHISTFANTVSPQHLTHLSPAFLDMWSHLTAMTGS